MASASRGGVPKKSLSKASASAMKPARFVLTVPGRPSGE
jgi:hypothetical protein